MNEKTTNIFYVIVITFVVFLSCWHCQPDSGIVRVSYTPSDQENLAIAAVKLTITAVDPSELGYRSGLLQGGTAVMAGNAAYWVSLNRVVFAANGFAKMYSPRIHYSGAGVDIDSVENAVNSFCEWAIKTPP